METMIKNIRPTDVILAVVLSGLGAWLMILNITADAADTEGLGHAIESQSWLMLPVFLLSTVPVLFRRTNVNAVAAVTLVAMSVHVVAFGWVIRCGAALPLAFILAYSVGRFAQGRNQQWFGFALTAAVQVAVLVQDSAAGIGVLPFTVVIAAAFQGAGILVTQQIAKRDAGSLGRAEQLSTI